MNPFKIFAKFGQSVLVSILSIFLLIFYFSYVIVAIWLLILGDWIPLLQGIIFSLLSSWVYSIFLLPALGLGAVIGFFIKRKNTLMIAILSLIVILYQNALMIFWIGYIFKLFLSWETPKNFIPLLILAYNVAMGVFCFMAKGEAPDNLGTNFGLLLAFLTCLTMVFMLLFKSVYLAPLFILYIVASLTQFIIGIYVMKPNST